MPKFPDIAPIDYVQSKGLRILASEAFKYFYEHLDRTPGNYLEIGVFEGYMLKELATMYPYRKFYGIDPFIEDGNTSGHNGGVEKGQPTVDQRAITHQNVDGLKNVKLFEEKSRAWGERHSDLELEAMNVTAVFVDGDHSYEEALNDLKLADRLLPNGGFIYVDDAQLPQVGRAIRDFGMQAKFQNGGAIIWV